MKKWPLTTAMSIWFGVLLGIVSAGDPTSTYTVVVDGKVVATGNGSAVSTTITPYVPPVVPPTPKPDPQPPQPDPQPAADLTLGFFGDEMFTAQSMNLPGWLCPYNPAFGSGLKDLNQGDGGSSASWWVSGAKMHYGRSGQENIAAAAKAGAKVALFHLGLGDAKLGELRTPVQFRGYVTTLAQWATAAGMQPIFIGPPHLNTDSLTAGGYGPASAPLTDAYNAILADMAAQGQVGYVSELFDFSKANPKLYTDGVWPQRRDLVAAAVSKGLDRVLKIKSPGLAPPKLSNPKPLKVGLNVIFGGTYSTSRPFVNEFLGAQQFQTTDNSGSGLVPTTPEGFPLADTNTFKVIWGPAGNYKFTYMGTADVRVYGCGTAIGNPSRDASGATRIDIKVDPVSTQDRALRFAIRNINVNDPPKLFRLIAPDIADETTTFTPWFLKQLEPYAFLRMMEAQFTNGNAQAAWSDRISPLRPQQCTPQVGCSLELLMNLAVESGKPLWVNFYSEQTDDAMRAQAVFLRDNYPKDRPLILEFSNELWLNSMPQWPWRIAAGRANKIVMLDPRTLDGTPQNYAGNVLVSARQAGFDSVRCARICADVFGADYGTRVKFVCPGSGGWSQYVLEFIDEQYGDRDLTNVPIPGSGPKKFFHALITNYYLNVPSTLNQDDPALKAADLLTGLETYLATDPRTDLTVSRDLAKKYGLEFYGYEGGPGLSNPMRKDQTPYDQASSDPRMEAICHDIHDQCQRVGMDLAMYYKGPVDARNQWSWWQLMNLWSDTTSPKLQGVLRSIADFSPKLTPQP